MYYNRKNVFFNTRWYSPLLISTVYIRNISYTLLLFCSISYRGHKRGTRYLPSPWESRRTTLRESTVVIAVIRLTLRVIREVRDQFAIPTLVMADQSKLLRNVRILGKFPNFTERRLCEQNAPFEIFFSLLILNIPEPVIFIYLFFIFLEWFQNNIQEFRI